MYFNEVPIKGEGKIIGVEKNLIEWEVKDKKFLKALSLEREMFMQEDERWLRVVLLSPPTVAGRGSKLSPLFYYLV